MSSSFLPSRPVSGCTLIKLLVIASLAALLLAGCRGSKETPTPEVTSPTAQASVQEPVAEPPTEAAVEPAAAPATEAVTETVTEPPVPQTTSSITVAVNANFKPFLYLDENNNMAGFDIDLMNALSAAGNFEAAYVNRPFDGMIEALAAGEYDAAISAITINDTRKELIDFTVPYFEPGQAPFSFFSSGLGVGVRNDETAIMGKDDLANGVIIGVKSGTTGDDFASTLEGVTVVRFDESGQALGALADGAVDTVVVDIAVITDYIKENPGSLKLVGGPITEEQYGIAVNKNRTDVLEMLETTLAEIRADGTYDQIFAKWFSAP